MTRAAKKFLIGVLVGLALVAVVAAVLSAVGIGGEAVGENKSYEVTGEIKTLVVEIGAADFRIVEGDGFLVESNLKHLTFRQSGDKLILKERTSGRNNYKNAELVIYIPKDTVFKEIDISTGAGRFTTDSLSAEKIDLEFGAGEVNIAELSASVEADIEGGAGEITIGGGSLKNLSLDMGAGELNITSEMKGDSELDLGVGEVNITLIGTPDDYTVEMTKGIGSLSFNGEAISGGKTVGNGQNNVEINGGVGEINIYFK